MPTVTLGGVWAHPAVWKALQVLSLIIATAVALVAT